ncbi:DeoR/GlpR family DNA-binding transcription regulator [Paenibacillus tarimensis]|uniref:DeoR/GlpR family DNA-binding transcription regulator n=1 Tax=Paenibacillus tarimensis TaxID=416012 RepID=UPI001F185115|nr:DeoR/GlpR family DNA-binding transcription regulator [Paenibacillus tarimensis]MCF2942727.1 DeoR/GlpR family DNA-binding transcription regulator [Paenibacillus tarimensis]
MSILSEERKLHILERLEIHRKVSAPELARVLSVSTETIRRDLAALEEQGKLRRVYGGAVKTGFTNDEPPYLQRQSHNREAKRSIGRIAAARIEDGSTILIDVGTTTLELARAISGCSQVTILTNSLPVATVLCESLQQHKFSGSVMLLGGMLNPEQQSLSGPFCEQMIAELQVDQAFLSCGGISTEQGVTDYDVDEAACSRLFARSAAKVTVLADHTELGQRTFIRVIGLEQVNEIISDSPCPKEWMTTIKGHKISWVTAD